jgi:hypothetical protein
MFIASFTISVWYNDALDVIVNLRHLESIFYLRFDWNEQVNAIVVDISSLESFKTWTWIVNVI